MGDRLIYGLDPGPVKSALVLWDGSRVIDKIYDFNEIILDSRLYWRNEDIIPVLAIERIASMGMPVGDEVFETCVWTGRFMQAYSPNNVTRITRGQVKMNLCNSMRAKDANIRQALIDRLGVVGKKSQPGPLWGISGDLWSALGVAITYQDMKARGEL